MNTRLLKIFCKAEVLTYAADCLGALFTRLRQPGSDADVKRHVEWFKNFIVADDAGQGGVPDALHMIMQTETVVTLVFVHREPAC